MAIRFSVLIVSRRIVQDADTVGYFNRIFSYKALAVEW